MMNLVRATVFLLLLPLLVISAGCNSKKGKDAASVASSGAPGSPSGSLPVTVTPKDKADADATVARVLTQYKTGDYRTLYREASAGFQAVGTEGQFVAVNEMTRKKTGPFKEAKNISFTARPDHFLVYVYQVPYQNVNSELRLTIGRSKTGKMELCGLNQKDLPKK